MTYQYFDKDTKRRNLPSYKRFQEKRDRQLAELRANPTNTKCRVPGCDQLTRAAKGHSLCFDLCHRHVKQRNLTGSAYRGDHYSGKFKFKCYLLARNLIEKHEADPVVTDPMNDLSQLLYSLGPPREIRMIEHVRPTAKAQTALGHAGAKMILTKYIQYRLLHLTDHLPTDERHFRFQLGRGILWKYGSQVKHYQPNPEHPRGFTKRWSLPKTGRVPLLTGKIVDQRIRYVCDTLEFQRALRSAYDIKRKMAEAGKL